jgi:DNA recombination protein RmuC
MVGIAEYGLMVLGAALGIGIGWLLAKNRYAGDVVRAEAQVTEIMIRAEAQATAISQSKELMLAEMKSVATNAARQNSEDFLRLAEERLGKVESEAVKDYDARKKEVESLVSPIKEHLEKLEKATSEMELKREGAYHGLKRTAELLHKQTVDLRDTNIQLSTALRGSVKARGNWGEVALKNIAEAAGMLKHCDFDIEATLKSGAGGARVDLLAKIPNGGSIPVDSKVPLAAYWDGLELTDSDARGLKMEEHAKAVKTHINTLAKRDYPSLIDGVDFTVMFIPAEPILSTAFEYDPTLQEYAFSKHVLIVTPVTLIALLRTVGLYWQQHSMAENAKEIHSKAREFYDRVSKFSHDLAKMGRGINTVVSAYNDAVGSYDGSVIPSGRRLEELDVTEGAQRKLAELPPAATARTVKQLTAVSTEEE